MKAASTIPAGREGLSDRAPGRPAADRSIRIRPDRETFDRLAREYPMVPVWTELMADVSTPVGVFPSIAADGPGAILESVERSERWGRYSFVAGDPAAIVTVEERGARVEPLAPGRLPPIRIDTEANPTAALSAVAAAVRAPRIPSLPPLVGGLVGFLTYEAATLFDGSPHPGAPSGPPISLMVIDRAVVFDHWRQRLLLVAHVPAGAGLSAGRDALVDLRDRIAERRAPSPAPVPEPTPVDLGAFRPNIEEAECLDAIRRAQEHIRAGDIFQVVLSRRLSAPVADDCLTVYRRLRVANPSPYMFYLRMPEVELAGSSPESLVRVERSRVWTRPIAGTYPRGADPGEDAELAERLLADPKERAEHAMLVDLARNDLGRVCRAGSVRVTELMEVERFARVMHIVSTVEGDLRADRTPLDALAATFPAGTLTGAPKRRAMEIIAEREPTARGPYGGAAGYLSFAGDLDFCITIRTAVLEGGSAHVQAGAGVVADSIPERELRETEAKASALLAAVTGGGRT